MGVDELNNYLIAASIFAMCKITESLACSLFRLSSFEMLVCAQRSSQELYLAVLPSCHPTLSRASFAWNRYTLLFAGDRRTPQDLIDYHVVHVPPCRTGCCLVHLRRGSTSFECTGVLPEDQNHILLLQPYLVGPRAGHDAVAIV